MAEFELTTLESLPNELLTDIFEYLPGQLLLEAFDGSNSRFNGIIRAMRNIVFEQLEGHSTENEAFSDQVQTLVIRHFHKIDLLPYSNLRQLKLQWPSRQQADHVIQHFQLEHLHIGHPLNNSDTQLLVRSIFQNRFTQLRSFHLENLLSQKSMMDAKDIVLPNVQSASLFTFYAFDLIQVLAACPNLHRLSVKFFNPVNITDAMLRQTACSLYPNLHTLILRSVSEISLKTIDTILSLVPNLKKMVIDSPRCRKDAIDLKTLASILNQRLHHLRRFCLRVWLEDLAATDLYLHNLEEIRHLHVLFNQVRLSDGGERLIIIS